MIHPTFHHLNLKTTRLQEMIDWYALVVAIAFHTRVVLGEEPWLARTHGATWDDYRQRVRRWL